MEIGKIFELSENKNLAFQSQGHVAKAEGLSSSKNLHYNKKEASQVSDQSFQLKDWKKSDVTLSKHENENKEQKSMKVKGGYKESQQKGS